MRETPHRRRRLAGDEFGHNRNGESCQLDLCSFREARAVAWRVDPYPTGGRHVAPDRLPSDSPQVNVTERFWKVLRRRATHNRLFDTLADRKRSLRARRCYFQAVRQRIRTLIAKCYPRPGGQTASAGP